MEERYLLQRGTNRFYKWTARLAKRKDMVEVDAQTINVRVEAVKKELERTKALIYAKKTGTAPEELTAGAVALKNLEAELAASQKELQNLNDGITADPLLDEDEPANDVEAERKALMDAVETDPDIIALRAMKTVQEIADYRALNFGIAMDEKEIKKADIEIIRNQACIERTNVIQERIMP